MDTENTTKDVVIITGKQRVDWHKYHQKTGAQLRVIGMDKKRYPFPPIEAEFIYFNITKEDNIRAAIERIR